MIKFKKPVVAQDLIGAAVESVWFDRQNMALLHPDTGKRDAKGKKLDVPPPKQISIRYGVIEVSIIGEHGARYPVDKHVFSLHFYDDPGTWATPGKGHGAGGLCGSLVVNPDPKGYGDLVGTVNDISKTGLDEMEAAYRSGKDDEEGRANVAKWLQRTGRLPG